MNPCEPKAKLLLNVKFQMVHATKDLTKTSRTSLSTI